MIKNYQSNKINLSLSAFGLVLLLFISPCKVRNFIQAELGVTQTKVLNKSQSTISLSNCQTIAFSENIKTNFQQDLKHFDLSILENNYLTVEVDLSKFSLISLPTRILSKSNIPLYILYQNLLVYS